MNLRGSTKLGRASLMKLRGFAKLACALLINLRGSTKLAYALLIKLRGFAKLMQSSMVDCLLVKPRKCTKSSDIKHKSSFYNFISVQILGEFYNHLAVNVF